MTISSTDLKIFQAQRNRDTADGGGAMSPNEVVDGELNNVFDDISSEDRVTGRVSIRKVFPGVFSANTDRFFGAGLIIISPAEDPAVDVLMTRNLRYDDERSEVVNRIESFRVPGGTVLWRLFNNHLAGTASLTMFAPSSAPTPDLGTTIFLQDKDGVQADEPVKVQSIVSRGPQTFFDAQGAFQRDILTLELTRPLQNDWTGTEVTRVTTEPAPTIVRDSTIATGARFWGVKRVTGSISQGDLDVQVDSPFARIVPSTNAENPVADERAGLPQLSYSPAGDPDSINVSTGVFSVSAGVAETVHIGGTVLPGSISISGEFNGTDNGDGTISVSGSQWTVTADYATGDITVISTTADSSVSLTITATPAAAVEDSTLSIQISVLEQTRALNYIRTLRPLPAPGSVSVDYRSLNNWFRLTDDGNGSLSGRQPGEGGGTVNYATGTITATLAALPDIGTSIIIAWGTGAVAQDGSKTIDASRPHFTFQVPDSPMMPGTLTLSYPSGGSQVDLTSDAAGSIFDGVDEIGVYTPSNGTVAIRPLTGRWPDAGSQITYGVDIDNGLQEFFQPTPSGASDQVAFQLADPPVEPGSVDLQWLVEAVIDGHLRTLEVRAYDDGAGGLVYDSGKVIPGAAVNYTTGDISFPAALEVSP